MDFWFSYVALASIYVLLGLSTNLLVGIAGIFSVSQAAVFGVGAYVVAYFLMNDIMSFLPALAIAAVCCVALNILVTLPALRVSGDYFVVTSFGIQLLATAVFTNWTDGTGGANGLPGIPPPDLAGKALENSSEVVALCLGGMGAGLPDFLAGDARAVRPAAAGDPRGRTGGGGGRKKRVARKGFRRGSGGRLCRHGGRVVCHVPKLHRSFVVRSGCVHPAADHGCGGWRADAGWVDPRAVPAAGAAPNSDAGGYIRPRSRRHRGSCCMAFC